MRIIYLFICLIFAREAFAQGYYATRINAQVQTSPPKVTLTWSNPPAVSNGNITIYRKTKSSTNWGTAKATLAGTATSYVDNDVSVGAAYEYSVQKSDTTNPIGYIYVGVNEPAIHNRGALLLLIDSTFSDSCSSEITTLVQDLSGDGWEVITKSFLRSQTVATVKSFITTTAQQNSSLAAVYILGHIAVPYSGNIAPDGHTVANSGANSHEGAWPADAYYGDLDGSWTDASQNITVSGNPLNHNIPGDGKFDQNYFNTIELQVGRVDFYDMPAFGKTEVQLMKSYLSKAHQYKTGNLTVVKRGLIDDNFKSMQEGFAANGWRNFAPLVGIDSVTEKDFISTLNTNSYQWAYGCGAGSYTSCSGVGNTTNMTSNNMKAIFTILFGSYFGDWNYKNNFLKAPLCSPEPSLASFWAARPNWFMHHMALGETMGYSTRLSQNNDGYLYYTPIPQMAKMIHIALMGDPSLRTEYVKPVPSITLNNTDTNAGAKISWTASPEPGVSGYYIYRSATKFGKYDLRSGLVTGTSFIDSFGTNGSYWYMVRAAKLQTTPSGTYYNLSLGTSQAATFKYPHFEVNVPELFLISDAKIYPNPASTVANLYLTCQVETESIITLTDIEGRVIGMTTRKLSQGKNVEELNITALPSGIYTVSVQDATTLHHLKLIKTY